MGKETRKTVYVKISPPYLVEISVMEREEIRKQYINKMLATLLIQKKPGQHYRTTLENRPNDA